MFARDFDRLELGASCESRRRTITEADVVSFAALTGDWHPQHADEAWAAASPFGERIAHGMLVLSYALGLLPIDPDRVIALRGIRDAVFKRPAPIGTTIRVGAEVAELRELDRESGLVTLALRIRDAEGRLLARLSVDALWRREAAPAPQGEGSTAARKPLGRVTGNYHHQRRPVNGVPGGVAPEDDLSPISDGRVLI